MKKPFNILIVEDNEDHLFLIKKALEEDDCGRICIHIATDGQEAIDFVKNKDKFSESPKPDLILLDLKLPRKDGFDVLTELKSDEKYRSIPVVILTTSERDVDIKRGYSLGISSYITKPTKFDELHKKIKSVSNYWTNINTLPPKDSG